MLHITKFFDYSHWEQIQQTVGQKKETKEKMTNDKKLKEKGKNPRLWSKRRFCGLKNQNRWKTPKKNHQKFL